MSTSIKRNFAYNSILTLSLYLFPLLTFPYVTRTLGVDKIGTCDFVNSIIDYFCIISMMGMAQMGAREIARAKENKEKLSRSFSSLIILNLSFTVFALSVLFILIKFVPQFEGYENMLYIGSVKIMFNTLVIEWFYIGFENFNYITIRTILVRTLYVISVFVLVKKTEDYILYFSLFVAMVVINAIINIFNCRKYVYFILDLRRIREYISPFLKLGVYQILTAMYTSFNVFFLGMICGTVEVGYYSTAVKLYSIVIALYGAFTGVMIPRMSVYLEQGKYEEFYAYISKSVGLLLFFAMPLVVITEIFSEDIIFIIAGVGYEGAAIPMRIIIPLMVIVGLEQILIPQIMLPMRKDNAILVNSIAGAVMAITMNIILVPTLGAKGSAIVWVMSELVVLLSAQLYLKRHSIYILDIKLILRYVILALPITIILWLIHSLIESDNYIVLLLLLMGSVVVAYSYFGVIEVIKYKNPLLISAISKYTNYGKTKNNNTDL